MIVLAICAGTGVSALGAQMPVQTTFATRQTSAGVFTERQVQTAAGLIPDTAIHPRVFLARPNSPNLIQLVVDTLGVPERGSIRAVRVADSAALRTALAAGSRWRFTPAVASGCKVRQRVALDVGR